MKVKFLEPVLYMGKRFPMGTEADVEEKDFYALGSSVAALESPAKDKMMKRPPKGKKVKK